MDQVKVTVVQRPSIDPIRFIAESTRLTFRTTDQFKVDLTTHDDKDESIVKNLQDAMHSPLEHCSYSVLVSGADRAWLAQITRSRTFSYTSASQHYSNWKKPNFMVPIEIFEKCEEINSVQPLIDFFDSCNQSHKTYQEMQDKYGLDHSATRAVTSQAMRNNLLITGNIRAWLHVIGLRCCSRNVPSAMYIQWLIREVLIKECALIFSRSGPKCFTCGKCSEGKITCGKKWNENEQRNRWERVISLGSKWRKIYRENENKNT